MENQRKERKSFRKVFLIIPILFLTIVTLSVATYAWWNSLQTDKNVVVPVGQGVEVLVSVSAQTDKKLVPAGQVLWVEEQIDSVILTYTVELIGDGSLAFDVQYSNLLIGGVSSYNSLVNIDIYIDNVLTPMPMLATIAGNDFTVRVEVTLNKPASKEVYDAIKNKDITFTLTFTATPQP